MIDLVVCYSILEKCKSADAFSGDKEIVGMAWKIRQHRMVISEKLLDYYEEYFRKKSPEYLEWYRAFCTDILYSKKRAVMTSLSKTKTYIKGNEYLNELVLLSQETEDKIILIEPKRRIDAKYAKELGIVLYDSKDINDTSGSNLFFMYTLPVNGKRISEGENSRSIANWLGRFWREEDYIQIFDNYLLTTDGMRYLKNYFLKYVKEGADIEIYSLLMEGCTEQQITDVFAGDDLKKWKFRVYIVRDKKVSHARSTQGEKYIIQIDRGLSVFGRAGKTFQTTINIFENKSMERIAFKDSQLKCIVQQF